MHGNERSKTRKNAVFSSWVLENTKTRKNAVFSSWALESTAPEPLGARIASNRLLRSHLALENAAQGGVFENTELENAARGDVFECSGATGRSNRLLRSHWAQENSRKHKKLEPAGATWLEKAPENPEHSRKLKNAVSSGSLYTLHSHCSKSLFEITVRDSCSKSLFEVAVSASLSSVSL